MFSLAKQAWLHKVNKGFDPFVLFDCRCWSFDEVEADVVRLIFDLYLKGNPNSNTPPLGVTAIAAGLNERGYQTCKGKAFGVGHCTSC